MHENTYLPNIGMTSRQLVALKAKVLKELGVDLWFIVKNKKSSDHEWRGHSRGTGRMVYSKITYEDVINAEPGTLFLDILSDERAEIKQITTHA